MRLNLTGTVFGRLTAIRPTGKRKGSFAVWECRCECGVVIETPTAYLTTQRVRSCGCLQRESRIKNKTTHGRTRSPEYRSWSHMTQRCYNENDAKYPIYGGRGISVCDEWRHDFSRFYADMGRRPTSHHSIDRKDNDGPYAPWNCRWASPDEQMNNRSMCIRITLEGRTQTLTQWCKEKNLPYARIRQRVKAGIPIELALSPHKL